MTSPATGVRRPSRPADDHGEYACAGLDTIELSRVFAHFDPDSVEDIYSLSPLQAGILFHHVHRPGRGDYLTQNAYMIAGALDIEAFRSAWQHVVGRHPVLRTTFVWEGVPHPVQVVHRHVEIVMRVLDWSGRDDDSVSTALSTLLSDQRRRGVDLERVPPVRFDLIRVEADKHLFVWHQHHILFDGWSTSIVLDEALATYASLRACGAPPDLPASIPYRRHIAWLRGRDQERDLAFWRRTLAGFETPTAVPFVGTAPADARGETVKVLRPLGNDLTGRLKKFAREHRLTLNAVLAGAWALLLSRHSGERDVLFGTIMSGRSGDLPDVDRVVGLLVNTVPVRVDVDEDMSLVDWLKAVYRQFNDLRKVEQSGLADVQRCSLVRSGQPMFDTIFNFTTFATTDRSAGDLRVAPVRAYEQIGYPLGLTVILHDELLLQFGYETERVPSEDAERFFRRYEQVLAEFVSKPEAALKHIDIMPADERGLVLGVWVGGVGGYASGLTVGELFSGVVAGCSGVVALVSGDVVVSYGELEVLSNRLAHVLVGLGVGVDSRVGVALPRSVDLVVALLGIVKAGGACVALDPANPLERLGLLVADADPSVVVGTSVTLAGLGEVVAGRVVVALDDPVVVAGLAGAPVVPPPVVAAPLSLAHVCYTSGSTGRPKGVGLTHRGIIRLVHKPQYMQTGPEHTFVQLQPIAFDGSLIELYASLLNGAKLVVPPAGKLDIPDIAALVHMHNVTTLGLTSAMFHQMVEHDVHALRNTTQLLTGGDVVMPDAFVAPLRCYPGVTVVACYGPTENTTVTTSFAVSDPGEVGARVPIGRPIPQTTVYVLDGWLRPVPVGVTGELFTGGDGLARGYLRHPAATAERFLPDPFRGVPGARMYRTGDLVRWRADGVLDFVGRVDGQVKVRGFRIELGEIEARLSGHPLVAEAVVVAWADGSGHKRLVAYVVPVAGVGEVPAGEVKRFIGQALPEYMVPSAVVCLRRMPLNSHGKIDRAVLPDPAALLAVESTTAPGTPQQEVLAAIIASALGLPRVGIHDNFFDLGGDSILSIRIASQARQAGIPITSADLFDHQTIAELTATTGSTGTAIIADQHPTGDVPLTPMQRWFIQQDYVRGTFNQAVRIAWAAPPDLEPLRDALAALVGHHDALRLRLVCEGGRWRQFLAEVEPAGLLEVVEASTDRPDGYDEPARAAAAGLQNSLNPATGPLLRAALLRFGGGRPDELLIAVHHLAVDTVSWQILLDDLATAYRQRTAGQPVLLPPKTTSYQTWAKDLYRYAQSAGFASEAAFWQAYVGAMDPPSRAALPVDRPFRANAVADATTCSVRLDMATTEALLRVVPGRYGVQILEVLLAALAMTLRGWTGRDDHVIDLERHGREPLTVDVDVSRTVGWFTAIHPVRLHLPACQAPAECMASIRDELRALPRNGLGFGMARYLRANWPVRPYASSPELLFNYHGQVDAGADGIVRRVRGDTGPQIDPSARRAYVHEVSSAVMDGRLRAWWTYPSTAYEKATIARLTMDFAARLRAIAGGDAGGSTIEPVLAPVLASSTRRAGDTSGQ